MGLPPTHWIYILTAMRIASLFVLVLLAIRAGKAIAAARLPPLGRAKRLALALGLPIAKTLAPPIPRAAVRRIRFRLACVLLFFVGHWAGYDWLAHRANKSAAAWVDGIRARQQHEREALRARGLP
jgi:hypothetical protein